MARLFQIDDMVTFEDRQWRLHKPTDHFVLTDGQLTIHCPPDDLFYCQWILSHPQAETYTFLVIEFLTDDTNPVYYVYRRFDGCEGCPAFFDVSTPYRIDGIEFDAPMDEALAAELMALLY